MEAIPLPDNWQICVLIGVLLTGAQALHAQTGWPLYGHDPGGMRYSPLKQLDSKNVSKLALAWTYDTEAPVQTQREPSPPPAAGRLPRMRRTSTTPLVIGGVMYMSTAYNRVVALEPETGKKLWDYESAHTPAFRGIAYWPGDKQLPPQIVFGTLDGFLITLDAKTGRPLPDSATKA
jgi:quinoprotein glucose dehydrogenase